MSQYIEIPVRVTKDTLKAIVPLYDRANAVRIAIKAASYDIGRLRFVTFAGALDMVDRLYHGVLRFEPLDTPAPAAECTLDVPQLLSLTEAS